MSKINKLMEKVEGYKKIELSMEQKKEDDLDEIGLEESVEYSILDFVNMYVDNIEVSEAAKIKIKDKLQTMYNQSLE